ncbi:MAG: hypothetical protein HOD64_03840 [Candidatus Cloacimonetes bacterium]|jgi:hypothetical protein|nr:hypothetical protein [Candidatus Cloacimonadota bacterium]MBT4332385.1 hypothetical protein [Candidatus Cloacimonadota bacterium]MBT4576674.1 hypothetical protein [Candidatus Cloacimonadota bacterium]
MKIIIILLLITLLILSFKVVLAEEKTDDLDDYEIVTIDEKIPGSSFIHFVHFKNKRTGEIIKTIDLIEDNPYNHLPYEIEFYNERGNKVYKNINFDEFFTDKSAFVPDYIKNVNKVEAFTASGVSTETKNYAIVIYDIGTGRGEYSTGGKSSIFIYNSKGDILFKCIDLIGEGGRRCITPDGKYLAYTYGQASEYLTELPMLKESAGVKVYDIGSGEIILDRKPKQGYMLSGVFMRDNAFFIGIEKSSIFRYEIIRLDKKSIYIYEIEKNEMNRLQKLTKDGFQFGIKDLQDKNSYFRSIETDFEVEDF